MRCKRRILHYELSQLCMRFIDCNFACRSRDIFISILTSMYVLVYVLSYNIELFPCNLFTFLFKKDSAFRIKAHCEEQL